MQKVEGSSPFSRFGEGVHLPRVSKRVAAARGTGRPGEPAERQARTRKGGLRGMVREKRRWLSNGSVHISKRYRHRAEAVAPHGRATTRRGGSRAGSGCSSLRHARRYSLEWSIHPSLQC
jgi:hypothetical protein